MNHKQRITLAVSLTFVTLIALLFLTPQKRTAAATMVQKSRNYSSSKKGAAPLRHAKIKSKKNINPWNFTITLSSSRILLKREVKNSTLILSPKTGKKLRLKAKFSSLSRNGKQITYTIPFSRQHLLCPGDSSKNGVYFIKSSLFRGKRSVRYVERLSKNTLSGFVLQQNGKPIKKATVRLKTASSSYTCHTNQNGQYTLKNVKKPRSMTISKSGFQSYTISSLKVSSKGVICENAILKPKRTNECALEILVTDTQNHPLPDTTVQIFSSAKVKSSKQNLSSLQMDCTSQKDTLFCGKTDSKGRLLICHNKNEKPSFCTKIRIDKTMSLSYLNSYRHVKTDRTFIGNILNNKDTYILYFINNPSSTDSRGGYLTKKLSFSFQPLYTDHALLHIQLEKAPTLHTDSLSVNWESSHSSSDCASLTFSLYQSNSKKPFFEKTLQKTEFLRTKDRLFLPASLAISLSDGTYFARLCARDEENTILAVSSVQTLQIKNGFFLSSTLLLQQPYYSRLLAYIEETDSETIFEDINGTASFDLYQILDSNYFYIGTFPTSAFQKILYHFDSANLILSQLCKGENYLLCPTNDSVIAKNYTILNAQKISLNLSEEDAIAGSPGLQIPCKVGNTTSFSSLFPADFEASTLQITFSSFFSLTQTTIRNSTTYPNTILVLSKSNGKIVNSILTTPDNQTYFQTKRKNHIWDIYKNKGILTTSQDSYQKH